MKLITDKGEELKLEDLTSVIVGGIKKVVLTIKPSAIETISVLKLFDNLDNFFGHGNWMLMSSEVVIKMEVKDGQ